MSSAVGDCKRVSLSPRPLRLRPPAANAEIAAERGSTRSRHEAAVPIVGDGEARDARRRPSDPSDGADTDERRRPPTCAAVWMRAGASRMPSRMLPRREDGEGGG